MQPSEIATAFAEVWVRLAALLPGGTVERLPGGLLATTDAPDPSLRGPLIPLDDADAFTIAEARRVTRGQGRGLAVDHITGVGDLDEVLRADGFEPIVQRTVMTAPASIGQSAGQARIATDDDVAAMVVLEMEAFDMAQDAASAMLLPGWEQHGSVRTLIDDGSRVLSMATAHATDHGIGVFGVATATRSRRRGLASDVVAAAVAIAAEPAEHRPVWLHCEPDLEPVYASMGFTAVGESTVWIEGYA